MFRRKAPPIEVGTVILPVTQYWKRFEKQVEVTMPVCPYCGARSAWPNDCSMCHKRLTHS